MNQWLLAFAILSSSFWGSWHCAGMCGPVAAVMAQRKNLWLYNAGRGLSYTLMGALGGGVGAFFLQSDFIFLRWLSGALFAGTLLFLGAQLLRGQRVQTPAWGIAKFYGPKNPALVLGLLSVFLPCGWLYTYVLAAIASRSATAGALILFLFWLGGLPALSVLPKYLQKSLALSNLKKQRAAGMLLIAAGLYSLVSFYFIY